ncbi:MAG: hypothetical protein J6K48_10095 [Lachnospiraceae bacterium]|nr:hypothetical protein [Lachnospiraceae bacterium]
MSKRIMGLITEHAINERLDAILLRDRDFLALQEKINEEMAVFDSHDLSKEERKAVDRLICAYTGSAAYHSAAAYRCGFKDCASFLCEIGLVGKGCGWNPSVNWKPQGKEGKVGCGLMHRFYHQIKKILKRKRDGYGF